MRRFFFLIKAFNLVASCLLFITYLLLTAFTLSIFFLSFSFSLCLSLSVFLSSVTKYGEISPLKKN